MQEEKLVNIGLQTHGRRSVGYPGARCPQRSNRGSVSVPTAWKEGDARGAAETSTNRSEESEERLSGDCEGFRAEGVSQPPRTGPVGDRKDALLSSRSGVPIQPPQEVTQGQQRLQGLPSAL